MAVRCIGDSYFEEMERIKPSDISSGILCCHSRLLVNEFTFELIQEENKAGYSSEY